MLTQHLRQIQQADMETKKVFVLLLILLASSSVDASIRAVDALPTLGLGSRGLTKREAVSEGEGSVLVVSAFGSSDDTVKLLNQHSLETVGFAPPNNVLTVGDVNDARLLESNGASVNVLDRHEKEGSSIVALRSAIKTAFDFCQSGNNPRVCRERVDIREALDSENIHFDHDVKNSSSKGSVTLKAMLAPELQTTNPRARLSATTRFASRLQAVLELESGTVRALEPGVVAVRADINNGEVVKVLEQLESMYAVTEVHAPVKIRSLNKYSNAIIQGGSAGVANPTSTPVWDLGYAGDREIVGVADTGVNNRSCYFSSDKINAYISIHQNAHYIDYSGHGTHTAGTIAGQSNFGDEDGIAKNASLVVYDWGRIPDRCENCTEYPLFPSDKTYRSGMLERMHDEGARITSHSWGSAMFTEELMVDFDWHAYVRQDSLHVAAAGNDGENEYEEHQVNPPGNSKSTLTVGATLSPNSYTEEYTPQYYATRRAYPELVNVSDPFIPRIPLTRVNGDFANVTGPAGIVRMDRNDSDCGDIIFLGGANINNSFAYVPHDVLFPCMYSWETGDFLANISHHFGVQGFMLDANMELEDKLDRIYGDVPIARIGENTGFQLFHRLEQEFTLIGEMQIRRNISSHLWETTLAEFSSKGWTRDGRLKPEVVAPGDSIPSADANQNCSTVEYSGTSIATPAVAGSAAIVRQYLREKKDVADPSGAAVGAVLLNGAQDMHGFFHTRNDYHDFFPELWAMDNAPSKEQGFGIVNLQKSLGGSNLTDSPSNLLLYESDMSSGTGEVHHLCLALHSTEELRLTLRYHDRPADTSALQVSGYDSTLVNRISMSASATNDSWYWPMPGDKYAVYNDTTERLVLREPHKDTHVQVNITAERLVTQQPFALVATGDIADVDLSNCYDPGQVPNRVEKGDSYSMPQYPKVAQRLPRSENGSLASKQRCDNSSIMIRTDANLANNDSSLGLSMMDDHGDGFMFMWENLSEEYDAWTVYRCYNGSKSSATLSFTGVNASDEATLSSNRTEATVTALRGVDDSCLLLNKFPPAEYNYSVNIDNCTVVPNCPATSPTVAVSLDSRSFYAESIAVSLIDDNSQGFYIQPGTFQPYDETEVHRCYEGATRNAALTLVNSYDTDWDDLYLTVQVSDNCTLLSNYQLDRYTYSKTFYADLEKCIVSECPFSGERVLIASRAYSIDNFYFSMYGNESNGACTLL